MIVDTGSSTAAVAGTACTACAVSPKYTPGSSATDTHMSANAQYGSGSWTGEIYKDSLGLGAQTPAVPVSLASIATSRPSSTATATRSRACSGSAATAS